MYPSFQAKADKYNLRGCKLSHVWNSANIVLTDVIFQE